MGAIRYSSIIPMGALRYSCPVVPTYILPAKDIIFWERFSPIALKLRD